MPLVTAHRIRHCCSRFSFNHMLLFLVFLVLISGGQLPCAFRSRCACDIFNYIFNVVLRLRTLCRRTLLLWLASAWSHVVGDFLYVVERVCNDAHGFNKRRHHVPQLDDLNAFVPETRFFKSFTLFSGEFESNRAIS